MPELVLREFFAQPTPIVAPALLGQVLVRQLEDGTLLRGRIVETEAYHGIEDSACHGRVGRTTRTEVMYGPPGHAYVYLIYGMYDMLNISCNEDGFPGAVLIRAVEPLEGIPQMAELRGLQTPTKNLTNGPGKLCRAMAITRALHGWDMTTGEMLWVEKDKAVPESEIVATPRINIDYAQEVDRTRLWRFYERGNKWVSRK